MNIDKMINSYLNIEDIFHDYIADQKNKFKFDYYPVEYQRSSQDNELVKMDIELDINHFHDISTNVFHKKSI